MRRHDTYGVHREYRYYARLPAPDGIDALRSGLRDDITIILLPGNGTANYSFASMTGAVGDFEHIRGVVRSLGGVLLPAAPKPQERAIL